MSAYALVLDRAERLAAELPAEERTYAGRVVQLCRELSQRDRSAGKLVAGADDLSLKRELGRLSELLGRRASKALPAASLGRAALADLGGDLPSVAHFCSDCDHKLTLLGW